MRQRALTVGDAIVLLPEGLNNYCITQTSLQVVVVVADARNHCLGGCVLSVYLWWRRRQDGKLGWANVNRLPDSGRKNLLEETTFALT